MLHPSYVELIDHVNNVNREQGAPEINSRYTLVMAVAKRARDLVNGSPMMIEDTTGRMLTQAVMEMEAEKLSIVIKEEEEPETEEEVALTYVDLSTPLDEA